MLPISAGSVVIQSTLVDYRFGRLDKAAVAAAVVEVVRFVAITGVTVDAPTDAIVAAAGFVEVVEVVEVVEAVEPVDFVRSLAGSRDFPDCFPYPIDQTGRRYRFPLSDYLGLNYFPKSLGVTVDVAAVG